MKGKLVEMSKYARSPEELARGASKGKKKTYSYSLDIKNAEYLKERAEAVELSASALVDEAIRAYIEHLGERPVESK